jgi:hypothetical protein
MRVEGEHTLVLILGNWFLQDSLKRLEVEEGVDAIIDKIDVSLPPAYRILDNGDDRENEPHIIIPGNDRVHKEPQSDEKRGLEQYHDHKSDQALVLAKVTLA